MSANGAEMQNFLESKNLLGVLARINVGHWTLPQSYGCGLRSRS